LTADAIAKRDGGASFGSSFRDIISGAGTCVCVSKDGQEEQCNGNTGRCKCTLGYDCDNCAVAPSQKLTFERAWSGLHGTGTTYDGYHPDDLCAHRFGGGTCEQDSQCFNGIW